jgi:ABC-type multidrug transport system ATPase subunit
MLTVEEQLQFFAHVKGVAKFNVNLDVTAIMSLLGLTSEAHKRVSKLSGGNKRKLMLAIAIVGLPDLVILDEPTSAMDSVAQRSFWRLISSISPGTSIVLTVCWSNAGDVANTDVLF